MTSVALPANEPVLSYAPGSPERGALREAIGELSSDCRDLTQFVDGAAVGGTTAPLTAPHRHALVLGNVHSGTPGDVVAAIQACRRARHEWAALSQSDRSVVFSRAADLLAGPWRQRLNAATLLGQSKTPHQAEIDSACELIDFLRFNVAFAARMAEEQPLSVPGVTNRAELRPLDGFVYAVTPFNFTAIAGNLPTAPALLGNTVLWKPSPKAALSAHFVMALLVEAGLPPGVINLVQGDPVSVTRVAFDDPDFGGLHYTGSTEVFRALWRAIGEGIGRYRSYPRIVGETGGKDFIFAHPSANLDALAVAIVRGGYEYQGQKCSAASRIYVPRSLWPALEERLRAMIAELRVGDPADFSCFMGAVIDRGAFDRIRGCLEFARTDPACRIIAGGGASADEGFFVEPTLVEVTDPVHRFMREEIFGPVVAVWVYDDSTLDDAVSLCDRTSGYALTGAVFGEDRSALDDLSRRLRFAAGNFYLNDKPTGAVVGQQPFGGGRASGTNDKAGSAQNLWRWVSSRTVKETHAPATDWRYPYLASD